MQIYLYKEKGVIKIKNLLKNFLFYNILLFLVTLFFVVAFFVSQSLELHLFDCAFYREFGIYCPGCGGTRSLIFLLRFDLANSFLSYPPLLISFFLILTCDLLCIISFIKKDIKYIRLFKREYFLIIPTLIILNFLVRIFLLFLGVDYMPTL